ncbi:MAG: hypothetical protein L0J59_09735, partial [Lactococcus lactis]|nr:hypothetical protein [Lactococcus lactis]
YILLFLLVTLLIVITLLFLIIKKIKRLDRRVEIMENFDRIIEYIESKDRTSFYELEDDDELEDDEAYGQVKTDTVYKGTRLDRLVREYLDLAVHDKKKK